jgi:hypothetical protein
MDPADKLSEIRTQIRDLQRDLVGLEARAGIAKNAEKLRRDAPHYEFVYDAAERFSDRQRELEEYEERSHEAKTTWRLRDLYFSVRDAELRKELIAKEREIGQLAVDYWRQELAGAAVRLKCTKSAHQKSWVSASIWGVLFIGLGFYFIGFVGALTGLLVGYLWSRELQHRALSDRESVIEEASREFREAEQTWNEVRNEPLMFSQREAKTGEPDPR